MNARVRSEEPVYWFFAAALLPSNLRNAPHDARSSAAGRRISPVRQPDDADRASHAKAPAGTPRPAGQLRIPTAEPGQAGRLAVAGAGRGARPQSAEPGSPRPPKGHGRRRYSLHTRRVTTGSGGG